MRVKYLSIETTFRVGLVDLEIPDSVYSQILEASENGKYIDFYNSKFQDAAEWLSENIKLRDACDCSYEIEEITPIKILAFRNKVTQSIDWRGEHPMATIYPDSYYLDNPQKWEPIFESINQSNPTA